MDELNTELILLLVAVAVVCIGLPLVVRRFIDARRHRAIVRKNARTLHDHYELATDSARLRELTHALPQDVATVQLEFAIDFDGRHNDAADVQRVRLALESMGMSLRMIGAAGSTSTICGTIALRREDAATLCNIRGAIEELATRNRGSYGGWELCALRKAG